MKVHQTIGADNLKKKEISGNKSFEQSILRYIFDICVDGVHAFISMASLLLKLQSFEHDFHKSCFSTSPQNYHKTYKVEIYEPFDNSDTLANYPCHEL